MYSVLYFRGTYRNLLYYISRIGYTKKKIIISKYKIIFNLRDFDKLLITISKSCAVEILIISNTFNELKTTIHLNVLKVTFIIENDK